MAGAGLYWPLIARDEATPAFLRVAGAADKTAIATQRATKSIGAVGAMSTRMRGAVGGLAKDTAKLGAAFGVFELIKGAAEDGNALTKSLNSVQAASNASNLQMRKVRAEAIGLGKDLTVPRASAIDAANAIDDLVRAGVTLPRAMRAARPALLLASAANVDVAESAKDLGDVLDEFQLPASRAAKVAGQLAAGATHASGGLTELFSAFSYAGTRARALGLDTASVTASIVDLAKAGIVGARAGTGLAMTWQRLASESPKGTRALDDLGVSAFTATGQFKGMPSLISGVSAAMHRMGPDSKRFLGDISDAFGARASNVIAAFAGKGVDSYNRFLKIVKSGNVQRYADLQNRGVSAGFAQLRKEATAAGISLYSKVEPAVSSVVMEIGTNLPGAVNAASQILHPFATFAGGALSTGWRLFGDTLHVAGAALIPVAHFLEAIRTPLGAIGTLALGAYAGFKLFALIPALMETVALKTLYARDAVVGFGLAAKSTATSFVTSSAVIAGTADATATDVAAAGTVARVGWVGILGPIGAIAVGVGVLVSMFHKSSGASKEATDAAKAYTAALSEGGDSHLSLMDTVQQQLTDNNVPQKIADLNKALGSTQFSAVLFAHAIEVGGKPLDAYRARLEGVVAAGKSMNENIARGAAQQTPAYKKWAAAASLLQDLNAQYSALNKVQKKDLVDTRAFAGVSSSIDTVSRSTQVGSDLARQYATMMGIVVDKNGIAAKSAKVLNAAVSTVASAYAHATATGAGFLAALSSFSTSAGTAADRAALIGATLKAANGEALDYVSQMNAAAVASHTFAADVRSAAKDIGKSGESTRSFLKSMVDLKNGTIDFRKAAAAPLITDLQGMQTAAMNAAEATFQNARATMSGKRAADAAYKVYRSQTSGQLVDQLKKLGANTAEAHRLAQQYFGMPKNVKTLIEAQGTNPIITVLNKIGHQLSFLTGHPWKPKITVDPAQAITGIASVENRLAHLHDKTIRITTISANAAEHANGRASGGGLPRGWSSVGERGAELVYNRGGSAHVYSHAQSRAIIGATGMRAPGFAAGTTPDPKTYRLTGAPGLGGSTYSTRHAADRALAKAVATLERVFGKMSRHDLPNLTRALGKTGSDVKSAVGAWLTDAKQLGLGVGQRRSVAAEGRHVAELVNRRNREQARLQKSIASRAAEKHTVAAAGRGVFDITQAGANATGAGVSFGALNAQALQSKHLVHKWAAGIRKLGKEGFNKSPTGLAMLRQLAEGGPADWPQVHALLSATPKQLAGLLSTERSIDKASSALGGYVGTQLYGDKISHERTQVQKDRAAVVHEWQLLRKQMREFMARPVEIDLTVDGRKIATATAKGTRRNARRR